jgi:flagellar protein FlaG
VEVKKITPVNNITKVAQTQSAPKENVLNQNVSKENAQQGLKNQQVSESKNGKTRVDKKDAETIVEIMNKAAELYNHQLNFEVYEDTSRMYVQIIDKNTHEVIKQIPSEEMLELSAKIQEMVGIMLDKYV